MFLHDAPSIKHFGHLYLYSGTCEFELSVRLTRLIQPTQKAARLISSVRRQDRNTNMKILVKKGLKWLLAQRGLAITRIGEDSKSSSFGYISAKETVSAAEHAGLSVCDYVEKLWEKQGDTQRVIEQMASCGAFATANPNVVEIGAGTGRYLEKVLQRCGPAKYESYETARDWAEWLQSKYPIVSHEADGMTLRQTPSMSADLIHAHGVFVYLPFLVSYRYWSEIWRITRENGIVAFDIISEECLDEQMVDKWLN